MPAASLTTSKTTERNHPQFFHLKKIFYLQANAMSNKQSSSKEPLAYDLFLLGGSSLGTSLTGSKVVGAHSLGTRGKHNVYISAVVLLSLLTLTSTSHASP